MNDERICYSIGCTWWDTIYNAGTLESTVEGNYKGLPCCPHCNSVLMEMENEGVWWHSVDQYALKENEPDYPNFIQWMRGKCFTDMEEAKAAYGAQRA